MRPARFFSGLLGSLLLVIAALDAKAQEGAGDPLAVVVITEADNGMVVPALVGQIVQVDLRGNATTGYSWLLSSTNGDSVASTGPVNYAPDPGGGVGGGGTFGFPFQAIRAGKTTFAFEYRHPWDPSSVIQTFTVTLNVADGSPRLDIALDQAKVVVTWPIAGSDGFVLEGTSSLAAPQWATLNVLVVSDGDHYRATVPVGDSPLFLRLRR